MKSDQHNTDPAIAIGHDVSRFFAGPIGLRPRQFVGECRFLSHSTQSDTNPLGETCLVNGCFNSKLHT